MDDVPDEVLNDILQACKDVESTCTEDEMSRYHELIGHFPAIARELQLARKRIQELEAIVEELEQWTPDEEESTS